MTRAEKVLWPVALGLLLVAAYVQIVCGNAADKNWLLLAARMMLQGKKLYVDLMEVNPPLILWIYSLPVWLSLHLAFLEDYQILALLGCALAAVVLLLSLQLIRLHPAFAENPAWRHMFIGLLAYVFMFFTTPIYFMGPEYILLVLTFPYLLRFAPTIAPQRLPLSLRITIGALAAVGFCIKPHALIVFFVIQALICIGRRSLFVLMSVENLTIYLLGSIYMAVIIFCLPEYLDTVLPMAWVTYSAYSVRTTGIYNIAVFLAIMAMTFVDFRPRYRTPLRAEVYYFLGICIAYLAYALINNGWAYTYHPLISIARFLAGWVLLEFLWLKRAHMQQALPAKSFMQGARGCGLNLLLNGTFFVVILGSFLLTFDCDKSISCQSDRIFYKKAEKLDAHSFSALSLEADKWPRLSRETDARWDMHFNCLWMLPAFIVSGPDFTARHFWIKAFVGNSYAQDLEAHKPDIVFVDASPLFFRHQPQFDLLGYYKALPAFRRAWAHYRQVGIIDACISAPLDKPEDEGIRSDCRFNVYRRLGS